MIKYYCPGCSQKLGVPDNFAGHRVRCTKCGKPSLVPSPAAVIDELEMVDEPALSSAANAPAPQHEPPSSRHPFASSSDARELDSMETGPDPLALAAARAAQERKYTKAILQANTRGGSSPHPTFGLDGIPLPARIPLALLTSIILAVAVGLLWAWVASASGWIFGIFSFLAAGAAAWGLTLYTENRNVGLGAIAVVLGLGAILFGKYMVGRWAVLPLIQKQFEEMKAQDNPFFLMDSEQLQAFLTDDDAALSIACASLIRSGRIDEAQGKQYIVEQQTKGLESADLTDEQMTQIREQCTALRDGWNEQQRNDAVRRNAAYVQYTLLTSSRTGEAITQSMAFAGAFSFLDLILIPMSLAVAFKTGAGRS